jgi:signal peptidase II
VIAVPPLARRGLVWAFVVLILDQITKQWIVMSVMNPPRMIEVAPFFNIVMVWTRGISFGLFNSGADWNSWVMPILALLITAGLLVLLWRTVSPLLAVALGLVIGGALGNVIDRLRFGAVADFLDFHWADWHWPAFNVADAAICLGALAFVAESLFAAPEKPKTKA